MSSMNIVNRRQCDCNLQSLTVTAMVKVSNGISLLYIRRREAKIEKKIGEQDQVISKIFIVMREITSDMLN